MVGKSTVRQKTPRTMEPDYATQVLRELRVVFHAVRNHFRAVESQVGVTGAQLWALSQAAANPGIGVSQLAAAMEIHQSTASNLIRALLQAKLVAVERGEVDRRSVHLHVTARGLRVLSKAPAPFTGVLPEALKKMDKATLMRLRTDLRRLVQELHADPDAAEVPLSSANGHRPRAARGLAQERHAPQRRRIDQPGPPSKGTPLG